MSYQIITRITITPDLRVMVRMAANNIRPLDFRYDEVVSLTETLRTAVAFFQGPLAGPNPL